MAEKSLTGDGDLFPRSHRFCTLEETRGLTCLPQEGILTTFLMQSDRSEPLLERAVLNGHALLLS